MRSKPTGKRNSTAELSTACSRSALAMASSPMCWRSRNPIKWMRSASRGVNTSESSKPMSWSARSRSRRSSGSPVSELSSAADNRDLTVGSIASRGLGGMIGLRERPVKLRPESVAALPGTGGRLAGNAPGSSVARPRRRPRVGRARALRHGRLPDDERLLRSRMWRRTTGHGADARRQHRCCSGGVLGGNGSRTEPHAGGSRTPSEAPTAPLLVVVRLASRTFA